MINSVQIAIDLLSALLTGGFLLFFIETMHIENDVEHRFKSIMNPFYHKLSKLTVYIGYMRSAMTFPNSEKGTLLQNQMDFIKKSGTVPLSSGRDIPYMKSDALRELCYIINEIWRNIEESPDLRRNLYIHRDYFGLDLAASALNEVCDDYRGLPMDINTLHDVTGAFFNEFWEPIEHCTPNYELWKKKTLLTRVLVYCSLGIALSSLILIMLWAECICPLIPCILAILTSVVFAVCIGMMAYLLSLSNRLFRAA